MAHGVCRARPGQLPFRVDHVSTPMLEAATAFSFTLALYTVAYSGFTVGNPTQPPDHPKQFQLITPKPALPAQPSCYELSRLARERL